MVVVATVHAADEKAAGLMRLEKVSGEKGRPTLRVIYPTDEYDSFLGRMFGGGSRGSRRSSS